MMRLGAWLRAFFPEACKNPAELRIDVSTTHCGCAKPETRSLCAAKTARLSCLKPHAPKPNNDSKERLCSSFITPFLRKKLMNPTNACNLLSARALKYRLFLI
jgi:hypothetical protein